MFPALNCGRSKHWASLDKFDSAAISTSYLGRRLSFVQVFLKPRKNPPDLFRLAQVCHGIGNGIVVFEPEQRRELFLIEFLDTNAHVMGQHEVEKDLLLAVKTGADYHLSLRGTVLAGERWQGVGDVRQHVEQVAFLGVDDALHLCQLVFAKSLFGKSLQEFRPRVGCAPETGAVRLRS